MIWNTLKIGILVICSNLEFLHLAFPHHLVSQHDLAHQHGLAVHLEKKTLDLFAREVGSLIHRVHSDVNLIVGRNRPELSRNRTALTRDEELVRISNRLLWRLILELEVPVQQLDLAMLGKGDHIVAVLYRRDLAKHPNVLIQSEDSQDQRTHLF